MAATLKGNDMTDLEATRLCAEAMGLKRLEYESAPSTFFIDDDDTMPRYDPLHNDAQCMALVKRFMLHIDAFAGMAEFPHGELYPTYDDDSLNRAIVYCVAKMRAAIREGNHDKK